MSTVHLVPEDIRLNYETHEWRNAVGVLSSAYPTQWNEILSVLRSFRLKRSAILEPGGNKSSLSKAFDIPFLKLGWIEKQFQTSIVLDGRELKSRLIK